MQTIPVKLHKTFKDADSKYGWEEGVEGLCVDFNTLTVAEMAQKRIEFVIKGRRKKFVIDPTKAKNIANRWDSFFTRRHDRKVVVVLPLNECERVE